MSWSPYIPFSFGPHGEWEMNQTVANAVRQNIKMLVLTVPGERPGFPKFGVGLRTYLFETFSPSVYARIENNIRKQVEHYMPIVKIQEILFDDSNADSSQLKMRLKYALPGFGTHFLIITT